MNKCPLCSFKNKDKQNVVSHIERDHNDSIPKNFSPEQFYYMLRTGREHGSCIQCKQPTGWNAATGKYHRYCKNPKCKEEYKAIAQKRMIGKYGKTSLLNDPEHQKKMLANRSISGQYVWSDGKEFTYTGSYEKDFLQFLDVFLDFDSSDIFAPSPHTYYYMYKGEKKFYIPDFFIASLNLEIEIKDGGNNINTHAKIQAVDKVKEKLKDEVLASQKLFSYIKVMNKEYNTFVELLINMKDHLKVNGEYAQVVDLGDGDTTILSRPVVESIQAEDYDIDAGLIRDIMESTDSVQVLESLLSELEDDSHIKDELEEYVDKLIKDGDESLEDLLNEIDYLTSDGNMDIHSHLIDGYLKEYGHLDIVDRTPGFVSANTGNLFVDIVNHTINDSDLTYVKETLCDLFRQALISNGTPEMINVYKRDSIAMQYYFKLLADKLGVKKRDINSVREYLSQVVTEAMHVIEGTRMYPVYVLLTHSGTVLSNIIKSVTDKPYSHASISFDDTLEEMYSFGRKYKDNPFIGTFVSESIKEGLYEDVSSTASYSLYVTFVNEDELKGMRDRLEKFQEDGVSFKYSFKGLLNYKFGKESDSVDKFFCSQFVDYILSSGKQYFDKHSSLVEPMDFSKHKDFHFVSKGILKNYNSAAVKVKVTKISKETKLHKTSEPKVVYIGLTTSQVLERKVKFIEPGRVGDALELPTSLPMMRRMMDAQSESNYTHYAVIPIKSIRVDAIVSKSKDSILIRTPMAFGISNINKL